MPTFVQCASKEDVELELLAFESLHLQTTFPYQSELGFFYMHFEHAGQGLFQYQPMLRPREKMPFAKNNLNLKS
jgi:hypothetical protein